MYPPYGLDMKVTGFIIIIIIIIMNICMYVCNQNLFRQHPLKSLLGGPSGLF